jgi:LPXTG-site transpeptidase (sortase) family protein
MKKVLITISGLFVLVGVLAAIRLAASRAVAEVESGLSPFTALPLNDGRNTGMLAPGESRWYQVVPNSDGSYQRQANLTLFFTPDDGNRAFYVGFQIFSADQITNWYWVDRSQMPNLGAGGVVSRDGNPVTGELLWSGWIMNDEIYYVEIANGTDTTIDYWLFTDDVIAAELGPVADSPPLAEASGGLDVSQPSSPVAPVEAVADPLLPLASELGGDGVDVSSQVWGAPYGTPTRLVIPVIALDSSVVPVGQTPVLVNGKTYGQWNTTDNLVGWHNLSAKLGQAGNTVLNGHSDVSAAVFRDLPYVDVGDEITVFSGDQVHRYVVNHKFLVREGGVALEERIQNAAWIASTQDERLTLVTCANPGATHRLILIAQPVGGSTWE